MKKFHLLVLVVLTTFQSFGQLSPVFAPGGKAIRGYDPVAFFTESRPVMGYDSLSSVWNGATWMFATKENKDLFVSAPEKYAPQYGGYCAYGTSEGHKAATEVDTWSIVNEKLYFNYNKNVQKAWSKNQHKLIEKADALWPAIQNKE